MRGVLKRPYRLRSERLAQAVKLDRFEELMPGTEERVSAHVADTIESPWGLSSFPHFDTIHKQTTPRPPSHSVLSSLSVYSSHASLPSLPSLPVVTTPSLSVGPTARHEPCYLTCWFMGRHILLFIHNPLSMTRLVPPTPRLCRSRSLLWQT